MSNRIESVKQVLVHFICRRICRIKSHIIWILMLSCIEVVYCDVLRWLWFERFVWLPLNTRPACSSSRTPEEKNLLGFLFFFFCLSRKMFVVWGWWFATISAATLKNFVFCHFCSWKILISIKSVGGQILLGNSLHVCVCVCVVFCDFCLVFVISVQIGLTCTDKQT